MRPGYVMFKKLSIGWKLVCAFGLLTLLAIAVGGFAIFELNKLGGLTGQLYEHPYFVGTATKKIQNEVLLMSRALTKLLNDKNPNAIDSTEQQIADRDKIVHDLFEQVYDRYLGKTRDLHDAYRSYNDWADIREEEFRLTRESRWDDATKTASDKAAQQVDRILDDLEDIVAFAEKKADSFYRESRDAGEISLRWMTVISVVFALAALMVAWITARNIGNPVRRLTRIASRIASGASEPCIESDEVDEIGQLTASFNSIIAANEGIMRQAREVAGGNYRTEITPRSDKDELGAALQKMSLALRNAHEDRLFRDWIMEGLNELHARLQGNRSVASVASQTLEFLALRFGAQVGAFYVYAPDRAELALAGSHAVGSNPPPPTIIKQGEGLVGQAALQKEIQTLENLPPDYCRISSATGGTAPTHLLLAPFFHKGELAAVAELGAVHPFDARVRTFLQQASHSIAVAVLSAQSRERLAELLEKTQQQAEELQLQQEELRQTNEELQEQSALIEEQKQAVQLKNSALEEAQRLNGDKTEALEKASRYKTEFLANMSHELRTPLNSILLLSKLLIENKSDTTDGKRIEFAQTINAAGSELLKLVNDILDLAKIEAGRMDLHPEELYLNDIVTRLDRLFAPIAQSKGIRFKINVPSGTPLRIRTDRQKLDQILRNLLSNACKFTERGGVTLSISTPQAASPECLGAANPSTYRLVFAVTDTGIGIPEAKQGIVFEAFRQADGGTSRKYGGTGLGLTISRELARLLGARIVLQSKEGSGSTFALLLPEFLAISEVAQQTSGVPNPVVPPVSPVGGAPAEPEDFVDDRSRLKPGDKSILIIESDKVSAQALLNFSRERGFLGLTAFDAKTGLHFADYYQPSAIVLDVGCSDMDGWSVLARLKENQATRHIPTHVMSATDRDLQAMKMGAVDVLVKPVTMSSVAGAFERIEKLMLKKVKQLLLVEDEPDQRAMIKSLLEGNDIDIVEASTGAEARKLLHEREFECMILDLGLPDMDGTKLLMELRADDAISKIPVIVYTGLELPAQTLAILDAYAEKVIFKGVKSGSKLIDDAALFLHRVEQSLPEEKQRMIRLLHDQEAIFKNKRILIVDDDMRNVYALSNILEDKGLFVTATTNGSECLDRLAKDPNFSLVLMDIMMPVMDGCETMKQIRKMPRFAKLPIIALTAKAMKGDRSMCIEAGASDYLAKPVEVDKLFSMLRVWLYQ